MSVTLEHTISMLTGQPLLTLTSAPATNTSQAKPRGALLTCLASRLQTAAVMQGICVGGSSLIESQDAFGVLGRFEQQKH